MRTLILGAGGHARSLKLYLPEWVRMISNDDIVKPEDRVYIGIGDISARRRLFEKFRGQVQCLWRLPGRDRDELPDGIQVFPSAHVSSDAKIGVNVLVNTGAQIDHDCTIGDHCVLAPSALLCGGVTLGEGCFVGAGAIILENVTLEPDTVVPAGTLVVGSDDFRKPIRMVRDRGADQVDLRQEGADFFVGA